MNIYLTASVHLMLFAHLHLKYVPIIITLLRLCGEHTDMQIST